ncbi:MAG: hypothetical protein IID30_09520 [Planctomycetes bacterium]|nr:hypothetical protein [Planctomycetota bacterium]
MNDTDPNVEAARIVGESAGKGDVGLPGEFEEAWAIWFQSIKDMDQRTWTLLRAAFEAGFSAASTRP